MRGEAVIADQLQEAILTERGFDVGTERKWKEGTFVKKAQGWVEKSTGKPLAAFKMGAGAAKKAVGAGTEKAKEVPQKVARAAEKGKEAVAKAPEAIKTASKGILAKIKGLPADAKKLVTDRKHRSEMGKKMGEALKRKSTAAVKNVVGELKELKDGGAALKKLAMRQKLDAHDKHALKESAKAIGMTVAGTIAMGGIGHLTAAALGTHFAAETLVKHVGRAALFADLQRSGWPIYESDEDAIREVVERVIAKVTQELNGLGSMSDEQIAAILSKSGGQSSAGDDEPEAKAKEPDPEDDDEPKKPEGGEKSKGERDWKPGSHNRMVKK
jgi:hypothetical protein